MSNMPLLGLTVVMAITSVNSMNLFGLDSVGVNFCCAEGEKLVVRKVHKVKRAECVGGGEEDKGASLEGKQVWVGGDEDGEFFFFLLTRNKAFEITLALGDPSDQRHCTVVHNKYNASTH